MPAPMRVIAGRLKGRRILTVPTDLPVRPISGRMRQTLFDILRPKVPGSYFLDLYAGTGAVGLEALSRGALKSVFVEGDRRCVKVIERNLARLGLEDQGRAFRGNVLQGLSFVKFRAAVPAFDLVFLGPPYWDFEAKKELHLTAPTLERIREGGILAEDGWIVAQHHFKDPTPPVEGLKRFRRVKIGDSVLSFYRGR